VPLRLHLSLVTSSASDSYRTTATGYDVAIVVILITNNEMYKGNRQENCFITGVSE